MQANENENVSVMENIKNIYQKHGLGGYYKGMIVIFWKHQAD